jgi:hypothetical protein
MKAIVLIIAIFAGLAQAYLPRLSSAIVKRSSDSATALFAHHPQKKIIKKKQDRRPIKSRLSDINRKNVNMNKCITKVEGAPADYTLVSADGEGYLLHSKSSYLVSLKTSSHVVISYPIFF